MSDYDLNMVRTFVLVYETRSARMAAEQLHVTQPAVSYNLGKLRRHFGDPLFVKNGGRMGPTTVADDLYPGLAAALAGMDNALAGPDSFSSAESTRTFNVSTTDIGLIGLIPRLMRRVATEAPRASLRVDPLRLSHAAEDLVAGRIDAVICTPQIHDEHLTHDILFSQQYLGVCAVDHPRITATPTLVEYLAERHVVIDRETGHLNTGEHLRRLGHTPDVALTIPNFTAIPGLMAETHYLGYAPQITADRMERSGAGRTFRLPFEVPRAEISLYMPRRFAASAPGAWLRSLILGSMAQVATEPPPPHQWF